VAQGVGDQVGEAGDAHDVAVGGSFSWEIRQ
jgi:hypothetical protein